VAENNTKSIKINSVSQDSIDKVSYVAKVCSHLILGMMVLLYSAKLLCSLLHSIVTFSAHS